MAKQKFVEGEDLEKIHIEVTQEMQQKEIGIKTILNDVNLLQNILNETSKKVEGEEESRTVIIVCGYGGRLVVNCQVASFNVLVNDDTGVGKDYVVSKTLDLLPSDRYIKKTRISPTTFNYLQPPEDTWNGVTFYTEDISENVMNSEVFKVMCSSGSDATIVDKGKAVDLKVHGKPVIITSTATSTPNPELTRRFVILDLDSGIDQTKAIKKRHSIYAREGYVPEYDIKIKSAMSWLKRKSVKIPFAELIDEHFPNNILMRTNYPRYLDFIKASCCLHQFQRECDEDGVLIATQQDYEIARKCFLKLFSNKEMIPLTINQKKILGVFEKMTGLKTSANELLTKITFIKSDKTLRNNMRTLASYGLLDQSSGKDSYNHDVEIFSLPQSYYDYEKLQIPEFNKLQDIQND